MCLLNTFIAYSASIPAISKLVSGFFLPQNEHSNFFFRHTFMLEEVVKIELFS
jgi:hypothetical protein